MNNTNLKSNVKKKLTVRELQVLVQVEKGLTNQEIADKLMITFHTVKAHIASILKKTGTKRRLNAAMLMKNSDFINLHRDLIQP